MKKLTLQLTEFLQFRQVAEKFRIAFTYGYKNGGIVIITANASQLERIGY